MAYTLSTVTLPAGICCRVIDDVYRVPVITFATLLCKSGESVFFQFLTVTIVISAFESSCNLTGSLSPRNTSAYRRFAATGVCTDDILLADCLSGLSPRWYPKFFPQRFISFLSLGNYSSMAFLSTQETRSVLSIQTIFLPCEHFGLFRNFCDYLCMLFSREHFWHTIKFCSLVGISVDETFVRHERRRRVLQSFESLENSSEQRNLVSEEFFQRAFGYFKFNWLGCRGRIESASPSYE